MAMDVLSDADTTAVKQNVRYHPWDLAYTVWKASRSLLSLLIRLD